MTGYLDWLNRKIDADVKELGRLRRLAGTKNVMEKIIAMEITIDEEIDRLVDLKEGAGYDD